jgi:hypothetical protein
MGRLGRRLDRVERRLPRAEVCPEHRRPPAVSDLRNALRAFSPDPADRAAYQADQEALAATPPCQRCGWTPDVIFIQTADDRGQHEPVA